MNQYGPYNHSYGFEFIAIRTEKGWEFTVVDG